LHIWMKSVTGFFQKPSLPRFKVNIPLLDSELI